MGTIVSYSVVSRTSNDLILFQECFAPNRTISGHAEVTDAGQSEPASPLLPSARILHRLLAVTSNIRERLDAESDCKGGGYASWPCLRPDSSRLRKIVAERRSGRVQVVCHGVKDYKLNRPLQGDDSLQPNLRKSRQRDLSQQHSRHGFRITIVAAVANFTIYISDLQSEIIRPKDSTFLGPIRPAASNHSLTSV